MEKNISMSIEDKEKNDLFASINLSENIETFNDAINSVMNDITDFNSETENIDSENDNENDNDNDNENCPPYA